MPASSGYLYFSTLKMEAARSFELRSISTKVHGITSQKTVFLIAPAVRTPYLTQSIKFSIRSGSVFPKRFQLQNSCSLAKADELQN
jgi:hypothetical protein